MAKRHPDLVVVVNSAQHRVKLVSHPDVVGVPALGPVKGDVADFAALFVDDNFVAAQFDALLILAYLTPCIPLSSRRGGRKRKRGFASR